MFLIQLQHDYILDESALIHSNVKVEFAVMILMYVWEGQLVKLAVTILNVMQISLVVFKQNGLLPLLASQEAR
jgi:hypothetical protein